MSLVTIGLLYVCQDCSWAPKFDYDYYVTKTAWCCTHCEEQYDKHIMEGAFGFIFKDELLGVSFLSHIRMPDGRFSNLSVFLKFFNLLRTGVCEFNADYFATLQSFIASLKEMIGNDARFAAQTLRDFGAHQHNLPIVQPNGVDLTQMIPTGHKDGFTL